MLLAANNLNVHGAAGQARPTITSSANTLVVSGTGARVSDLEVDTAASGAGDAIDSPAGGTFDDLAISATGPGGTKGDASALVSGASATLSNTTITSNENSLPHGPVQITAGELTVRNVTITHEDNFEADDISTAGTAGLEIDGLRLLGTGDGGIFDIGGTLSVSHSLIIGGVFSGSGSATVTESLILASAGVDPAVSVFESGGTMKLRNDTVISTGAGIDAITAGASGGGATITATNVIARSGVGGNDLDATAGNTINVNHSNFATHSGTVTDLGGNQSGDPQFVNPPSDYHLKPGSPAADAGTSAGIPAGETDLDGNLRVPPKTVDCLQQVDIGAYELTGHDSRCPVTTVPAANLPPKLSNAHESHHAWRLARKHTSRHATPVGTTFEFTFNEAANVELAFWRRVGKHTVLGGTLSLAAHDGLNKIHFKGRITHSRKLGPSRYTLLITAVNAAGQRSNELRLTFRIVR